MVLAIKLRTEIMEGFMLRFRSQEMAVVVCGDSNDFEMLFFGLQNRLTLYFVLSYKLLLSAFIA